MKRKIVPLLLLMLVLSACGISSGEGTAAIKGPDSVDLSIPDLPAAPDGQAEEDGHSHSLSEGDNVLEHEAAGYCGNTVTTISRAGQADGDPVSFWGSDSVKLTDLLRDLDYSGEVCRCLPEYTVDTEFGAGYGISLTGGYVRYNGGQAPLTAGQVELIQGIFDRQSEQAEDGL